MIIRALLNVPAWLLAHPEARATVGLAQIALFAVLYFRLSRGTGKVFFVVLSAAAGALFWINPWSQLVAFPLLVAGLYWLGRRDSRPQAIYQPATVIAEGGGIKRGLTVPEAALVLNLSPHQAVTAVLVGLLKKGMLRAITSSPLTLQVAPDFRTRELSVQGQPRAGHRRAAAQRRAVVLHPYEEFFLELLEQVDGQALNAIDFTAPLRVLERHTQERIRGYDRTATQDYYRKHLGRARHDIMQLGQGSKEQHIRDHHLEWLLLDESYARLYCHYRPAWIPQGESGLESLVDTISANLNSK
jgi:hypothetical protein